MLEIELAKVFGVLFNGFLNLLVYEGLQPIKMKVLSG